MDNAQLIPLEDSVFCSLLGADVSGKLELGTYFKVLICHSRSAFTALISPGYFRLIALIV